MSILKEYPKQYGPNIAPWEALSRPNSVIIHSGHGCGGQLAQHIDGDPYTAPRDARGKIYCFACGRKVGRALTAFLKRGQQPEFYAIHAPPDCDLTTDWKTESKEDIPGYHYYRIWFWEKRPVQEPEASGLPERALQQAIDRDRRRMFGNPARRVVEIPRKTTVEIGLEALSRARASRTKVQSNPEYFYVIHNMTEAVFSVPRATPNAANLALEIQEVWMDDRTQKLNRDQLMNLAGRVLNNAQSGEASTEETIQAFVWGL
jgi:hypothetical protein